MCWCLFVADEQYEGTVCVGKQVVMWMFVLRMVCLLYCRMLNWSFNGRCTCTGV